MSNVLEYFIKGISIGLIFGIPVGAIGALTIKRTLSYGVVAGIVSGVGCSIADLFYACISVFGFTVFLDFLLKYQNSISLLGGVLIIFMGIGFFVKKQEATIEYANTSKLLSIFTSSFFIAVTNPATILTFIMAFSIFNIGEVENVIEGILLVGGIFIGTCIWWIAIATFIHLLRKKITDNIYRIINRCLGGIISLFGVIVILNIFI